MKTLSRDEMKNVMGGLAGDPCTNPNQCGSGDNWDCVAGYIGYTCFNGRCKVINCP